VCFYVATLIVLEWTRFPLQQWIGLIAVSTATLLTIGICEHGRWPLGLFVSPRLAAPEFLLGCLWGASIIGACVLLVLLSSNVREARGNGFPWLELATTFIPAAVHEELLFRGYPFQKLHRWHPRFAIVFVALVFAALHLSNDSVTALGLANVFLGGILLGLAYARYARLWFPIGLHLAWNLTTGPILGHEVSGYHGLQTILIERGTGSSWITGGDFGLEGSVWMTVVVLAAIVLMLRKRDSAYQYVGQGADA
jgi:membrane protease YdiL (CAAX protease family)